jgi:hypothetical protein
VYPLLVLPAAARVVLGAEAKGRGGAKKPNKARQVERLGPQFVELQRAIAAQAMAISEGAIGGAPEHVLVFETIGPPKHFFAAIAANPDLEWLFEKEEYFDQDADFYKRRTDGQAAGGRIAACVYMLMFNQKAIEQLLSVWAIYKATKRMPTGFETWPAVFGCLRSIRRWGPEDRLRESQQLREALDPVTPNRVVPIEIELWPRGPNRQLEAEANIERIVRSHKGRVLDQVQIPEIRYRAMLVEIPHAYLEQILEVRGVDLVQVDDIYLLRAVSQCAVDIDTSNAKVVSGPDYDVPLSNPVCALLDGLPMENHLQLRGRLLVDDPDGWASTYPVVERKHGTAMASLIIFGDLANEESPIASPLYVRPILRFQEGHENAPRHRLWLDLIHQAVRRLVANDGSESPVASSVRIVNLSVGDLARPFLNEPSPVARLLDWLAWKHDLLFIVSAGNQDAPIPANVASDDMAILQHQFRETGHRRMLSPSETINGVTVGSLNHDQPVLVPSSILARVLPQRTDLPAAYSAFGRGVRRAVKPDLLAAGGRRLFRQRIPTSTSSWEPIRVQSLVGQSVAVPGPSSARQVTKTVGTSNAAALTSRAAIQIHDAIAGLLQTPEGFGLAAIPMAILVKALLIHTADWQEESGSFVVQALKSLVDPSQAKDYAGGILGYGVLRPERGLGCSASRATAIGGGMIASGQALQHEFPLPECLHTRLERRRLTVTLAWFTPINAADRKYRVARQNLDFPKGSASPLLVEPCQVHASATVRGTVQHLVLEHENAAMNIVSGANIPITVSCTEDAGGLTMPIHYALAVSLEMASALNIPIYEEISQRLRVRAAVRVSR